MSMFTIQHIDHVVLRVIDVKAMMDFYVDVLGCPVEKIQEEIGLYQVRAGSSLVDLVPIDGKLGRSGGLAPGLEGRNMDHFCLRIDPFDIETLRRYLIGKGIDSGEVVSRYGAEGEGPSVYLNDPEGNVVELKGPPWPA
jgi:glyoxylase I family protein